MCHFCTYTCKYDPFCVNKSPTQTDCFEAFTHTRSHLSDASSWTLIKECKTFCSNVSPVIKLLMYININSLHIASYDWYSEDFLNYLEKKKPLPITLEKSIRLEPAKDNSSY